MFILSISYVYLFVFFFFFQAEDGIRDLTVTGVQTCALPIWWATWMPLARELWPKGIHVAHPVIDGAIDTEFIRTNFPDRYALKQQDGILNPDHIADLYWQLHQQPRDAWTHETEIRPWMESW